MSSGPRRARRLRSAGAPAAPAKPRLPRSRLHAGRHAATLVLAAALGVARADSLPARSGESGLLDIPDAEVLRTGAAMFLGELRLGRVPGAISEVSPSPIAIGTGLGRGVEAALYGRQGGEPGDPRSTTLLAGAALKLHLVDADGYRPAVALDALVDRINWSPIGTLRAIVSTSPLHGVRLAAYGGVETAGVRTNAAGVVAGGALSVQPWTGGEIIGEALARSGAAELGSGVRWSVTTLFAFIAGVSWIPRSGTRFATLGIAILPPPPPPRRATVPQEPADEPPPAAKPAREPSAPVFQDERPHFRLRLAPDRVPGEDSGRHLQYEPDEPAR